MTAEFIISPELSLSLTQSVSSLVQGDQPPNTVIESDDEAVTRLLARKARKAIKMTRSSVVLVVTMLYCNFQMVSVKP